MQPQHLDATAYHPSRNGLTADSDADAGEDVFNTAVQAIIDAYGASAAKEGGEIALARGESPRSVAEDMINRFEAALDSAQRQAFQTTIVSALMRYVGATGAHKLEIRAHIGPQKPDGLDGDGGSMYWVRAFDGDNSYGDDLPQIHRHLTPEGEKMVLENNSELNTLYGDNNYLFLAIGAPRISDGGALAQDMHQDALPEQATKTDIKACLDALAEIDPAQAQALSDSCEAGELSAEELAAAQAIVQLHDMQELAALAPDAEGAPELIQAVRQQVQEASMAAEDTRIHSMLEQLAAKAPEQPQAQPAQSVQLGQAPAQHSRQTIKTAPKTDVAASSNASRPQQEQSKQTTSKVYTEHTSPNMAQKGPAATEQTQAGQPGLQQAPAPKAANTQNSARTLEVARTEPQAVNAPVYTQPEANLMAMHGAFVNNDMTVLKEQQQAPLQETPREFLYDAVKVPDPEIQVSGAPDGVAEKAVDRTIPQADADTPGTQTSHASRDDAAVSKVGSAQMIADVQEIDAVYSHEIPQERDTTFPPHNPDSGQVRPANSPANANEGRGPIDSNPVSPKPVIIHKEPIRLSDFNPGDVSQEFKGACNGCPGGACASCAKNMPEPKLV